MTLKRQIDKRKILTEILKKAGELVTEEDVKNKVVIPFLNELGYTSVENMRFEVSVTARVGTKEARGRADIVVAVDSSLIAVIDTKSPREALTEGDVMQAVSYAKLIKTPPAPYASATNGFEWDVRNILTGEISEVEAFPTLDEAMDLIKKGIGQISNIEIQEAQRALITLVRKEDLLRVFSQCAEILNKYEGLLSEQAFDEMSKILICKLNEEKNAVDHKQENRFFLQKIESWGPLVAINNLFEDAKKTFKGVFPPLPVYEKINIRNDFTIKEITRLLEPFAIYGAGEDIKGAVYETFLSGTLRGELGQYFTPREIVSFMVELIDPKVGESILDPAVGSGGFLIHSFLDVRRKIGGLPISEEQKKTYKESLIKERLWGIDINPRLITLCKINLIIHGDGYNHICIGDSLRQDIFSDTAKEQHEKEGDSKEERSSVELLKGTFNVILTNPPFNLPIEDKDILNRYALGRGKKSQGSDVLFLERCIELLAPNGRLGIVLPWGILNLPTFDYVRNKLLNECVIEAIISLPEGAFIPFGQSHAKTCILYARKKSPQNREQTDVFGAIAQSVGYDHRRKHYRKIDANDLPEILLEYRKLAKESSY